MWNVITRNVFTVHIVHQITVHLCAELLLAMSTAWRTKRAFRKMSSKPLLAQAPLRYFNQATYFYFWYSSWSFFDMETHSKAFTEFTTAIHYFTYRWRAASNSYLYSRSHRWTLYNCNLWESNNIYIIQCYFPDQTRAKNARQISDESRWDSWTYICHRLKFIVFILSFVFIYLDAIVLFESFLSANLFTQRRGGGV